MEGSLSRARPLSCPLSLFVYVCAYIFTVREGGRRGWRTAEFRNTAGRELLVAPQGHRREIGIVQRLAAELAVDGFVGQERLARDKLDVSDLVRRGVRAAHVAAQVAENEGLGDLYRVR